MKNTYDFRENNYTILDTDYYFCKKYDAAVIIYLYYYEQLDIYTHYIMGIPSEVDIYVITPVERIISEIKRITGNERVRFILRRNHGRDIAALLISGKELFNKYQYVCFVHDKGCKEKTSSMEVRLTKEWIKTLWDNTVYNAAYIYNILGQFDKDKSIGLLLPPEPIDLKFRSYRSLWCDDYKNTVELANKLKLSCDIQEEKPPISIGTAFWCRTVALHKLFDHNWQENDFPCEPVPIDGTINHAVERIFPFVAQDAGFKSTTVMSDVYAANRIGQYDKLVRSCFEILKDEGSSISEPKDICVYLRRKKKTQEIFRRFPTIYLYGAGRIGMTALSQMRKWGYQPKAFIESSPTKEEYEGLPVLAVESIKKDHSAGIIVCAKDYEPLKEMLDQYGLQNYIVF